MSKDAATSAAAMVDTAKDVGTTSSVPEDDQALRSLVRRVEALLFVAPQPVRLADLARALKVEVAAVEAALDLLSRERAESGVVVQRLHDQVQLATAPDLAADVERFLGLEPTTRLSQAALETLAIIAYKQPITRAQIEAIRGVNCDGVLRSLLAKGLIEEVGRLETVGRPILYGTTMTFLQYFGLKDLSELPPLEEGAVSAESLEQALARLNAPSRHGPTVSEGAG